MKFILSLLIIFLLIIVQASLYPYLKLYGAFPNLILILVLILSILRGHKRTLIWIIFGGFLLDIYSFDNPIGTSILGLFLISYLAYFFSQNIFKKTSIFSIILIGSAGTLVYRIFLILVLLIVGTDFQFSFAQMGLQVIYDLVIFIPLFYLIKQLNLRRSMPHLACL